MAGPPCPGNYFFAVARKFIGNNDFSPPSRSEKGRLGYSHFQNICDPKSTWAVPSTHNLRIPTGDCIVFPVSGALLKFFRAKTPPEEAVAMVGHGLSFCHPGS